MVSVPPVGHCPFRLFVTVYTHDFSKGKLHNSHFLMRAVKNNNQQCSIREMHSQRLWVLQVDCSVITSPEDPGVESFQNGGRQENFMLCRRRHALLPLETKYEC